MAELPDLGGAVCAWDGIPWHLERHECAFVRRAAYTTAPWHGRGDAECDGRAWMGSIAGTQCISAVRFTNHFELKRETGPLTFLLVHMIPII